MQCVDISVDPAKQRFFYQVFDVNSQPRIFDLSPHAGVSGSQVHVRGIGFPSDCTQIEAVLGGTKVSAKHDCSFTGFTFEVPRDSATGYLMVATPAGATVSGIPYEGESCNGEPQPAKSW
jgi:hypothetical protein